MPGHFIRVTSHECGGVPFKQPIDYLFKTCSGYQNRIIKTRVLPRCVGNLLVIVGFPKQRPMAWKCFQVMKPWCRCWHIAWCKRWLETSMKLLYCYSLVNVLSRWQKSLEEMPGSPCQAPVNPCRGWQSWRAARYDLLRKPIYQASLSYFTKLGELLKRVFVVSYFRGW